MKRILMTVSLLAVLTCLFLLNSRPVSAKIKTYISDDHKKITLSGKVEKVRFERSYGFKGTAYILTLSKPIYVRPGQTKKKTKVSEIQLTPNSKKVKKFVTKRRVKVKGTLFTPVTQYYIRDYALSVE